MTSRLSHPLLEQAGVLHSFGLRDSPVPPGLIRPRQVHGREVAEVHPDGSLSPTPADAVVSAVPGFPVGVATADCVPILACSHGGEIVAAIHAGWRGLSAGVVEAGMAALRRRAGPAVGLLAVIGPHIGPCCYEVDEPVWEALEPRFGRDLASALRPTRPGHALLDLGQLVQVELDRAGLAADCRGTLAGACTSCNADLFHSYRRDGTRAGRLIHYLAPRATR